VKNLVSKPTGLRGCLNSDSSTSAVRLPAALSRRRLLAAAVASLPAVALGKVVHHAAAQTTAHSAAPAHGGANTHSAAAHSGTAAHGSGHAGHNATHPSGHTAQGASHTASHPAPASHVDRSAPPPAVDADVDPELNAPAAATAPASDGQLNVGFVYASPVTDAGWTHQHESARLGLEEALGTSVTTRFVENVPENGDAVRVIRELASQGCRLIYTTSSGYMDAVMRVARDYPKVVFEQASGSRLAANLGSYNVVFYEGRYLAGLLAGSTTRTNVLGYVAASPIPEVVQGINAFTLAARSVNPQVQVQVIWTKTWFDPSRERNAADTLIRQGADVLTNHTGSPAVAQGAEAGGAWMLGYTSDMSSYAPTRQLAAVVDYWDDYYVDTTRRVLDGTWRPTATLGGLKSGMVRLDAISPTVKPPLRRLIAYASRRIAAGKLHPFGGRLVDNTGTVRHQGGRLSQQVIDHMDWYVDGVVIQSA
jgi:basic membrane protein A